MVELFTFLGSSKLMGSILYFYFFYRHTTHSNYDTSFYNSSCPIVPEIDISNTQEPQLHRPKYHPHSNNVNLKRGSFSSKKICHSIAYLLTMMMMTMAMMASTDTITIVTSRTMMPAEKERLKKIHGYYSIKTITNPSHLLVAGIAELSRLKKLITPLWVLMVPYYKCT